MLAIEKRKTCFDKYILSLYPIQASTERKGSGSAEAVSYNCPGWLERGTAHILLVLSIEQAGSTMGDTLITDVKGGDDSPWQSLGEITNLPVEET